MCCFTTATMLVLDIAIRPKTMTIAGCMRMSVANLSPPSRRTGCRCRKPPTVEFSGFARFLRGVRWNDGLAGTVPPAPTFEREDVTPEDYKELTVVLTELLWLRVTYTSFLLEGSTERKPHEKKISALKRLRDKCKAEALKGVLP